MGWRLGCSCRPAGRKCLHVLARTFPVHLHRLWALFSTFGTIFLHHNFTTIIGFYSEPVLFIKPSLSEGNVCWKAPIRLWLLIVAWSSLRRREEGACRLFWREKWKLARLDALTQICETCLMAGEQRRSVRWRRWDQEKVACLMPASVW